MRKNFFLSYVGQALQTQDIALIADTGAGADDAVLGELLRVAPYQTGNVARGILPSETTLVTPEPTSGSVRVAAFRGVVGERGLGDGRGITSTVCGGDLAPLAANASGNPRWDLVYAALTLEVPGGTTTRKVKDPTSGVVTDHAVYTWVEPGVAIGVVTGTPAALPTWPALPADTSGVYYIPIAYVRVPDGFTSASTVAATDIAIAAPILQLSRATGAASLETANMHYTQGAGLITPARVGSWGSTGTRPTVWMPPVTGGDDLVALVDLSTPVHANGTVIDSRDWRGRVCTWVASAGGDGPPWQGGQGAPNALNYGPTLSPTTNNTLSGLGQTFVVDGTLPNGGFVAYVNGSLMQSMVDGTQIGIYCDYADGGKLKLYVNGAPGLVYAFFWLRFSSPFQ